MPLLSFVSIVPLPLSRCSSTRPCEVCGSVSISLRPVRRAMLAKSGAHPGPGHLTNGSVLVLAGARRNLSQSTVQTLLLPRPDPRCPDPRCPNRRPPSPDPQIPDPQIPDPSSQIPAPILRLNPARGKRLGECLGSKMRSIFELIHIITARFWEAPPALAALAEPSPRAPFKPYFSRACPQDDVSSTRQTPSN